ncbi:hypothetical protein GEMRC1_009443 [Eukaryota sp. GEM-RC1]
MYLSKPNDDHRGSYKLWKLFLDDIIIPCSSLHPSDPQWNLIFDSFEQCLKYMSRMPVIWEMYLRVLMQSKRITLTRNSFNRSLRSLPLTQHYRIWPLFLEFSQLPHIPTQTTRLIVKRYLQYDSDMDVALDFFKKTGNFLELFNFLKEYLESNEGTDRVWLELSEAAVNVTVQSTRVFDPYDVIMSGINELQSSDNGTIGRMYTCLATCLSRHGQDVSGPRSLFLKGLYSVSSRADFSILYDAYTVFEESNISNYLKSNELNLAELTMKSLENILSIRPLLLNSIDLRGNLFQYLFGSHE